MSTKTKPRWMQIMDEVAEQQLAEKAAVALDLPAGETVVGARQTEAARARLRAAGLDPDACTEEEFLVALEAEGEQEDDVTVVRVALPLKSEPTAGEDYLKAARQILAVRGEEETYQTFSVALAEVERRRRT